MGGALGGICSQQLEGTAELFDSKYETFIKNVKSLKL